MMQPSKRSNGVLEPRLSITLKDYSQDAYDFIILGNKVFFSKDMVIYCHVKQYFKKLLAYRLPKFVNDIACLKTYDDFRQNVDSYMQEVLDKAIVDSIGVLVNNDILTIDAKIFKKSLKITEWNRFIRDLNELQEAIDNMKEKGEESVQATRENYGSWSGGGFGLKGALKGAFQAEMFNAVEGVFADMSANKKAELLENEIDKLKHSTFRDSEMIHLMLEAFGASLLEVGDALLRFLNISSGSILEREEQAIASFNNISFVHDKNRAKAILAQNLQDMPLNNEIYKYIISEFPDKKEQGDLHDIMDLLNVEIDDNISYREHAEYAISNIPTMSPLDVKKDKEKQQQQKKTEKTSKIMIGVGIFLFLFWFFGGCNGC